MKRRKQSTTEMPRLDEKFTMVEKKERNAKLFDKIQGMWKMGLHRQGNFQKCQERFRGREKIGETSLCLSFFRT